MKVFVPLLADPESQEVETLHHVDSGSNVCSVCGAVKFAQRFYYTEDSIFFDMYARQAKRVGMWSPKWEMIAPFAACTPHQNPRPKRGNFIMSNGTMVIQ